MRAIKKSYKRVPASLSSIDCVDSLAKVYNGGTPDKDSILSRFYRGEDVIDKLSKVYSNKCAYCETVDPDFEVEHYRPKKGIANQDLNGTVHTGYYWLAYEWSNLIPACHDCNKSGAKGNRFPIVGTRVNLPRINNGIIDPKSNNFQNSHYLDEIPLLIHPEEPLFDPKEYFKFNFKGEMIERARVDTLRFLRAKKTIEVVDLNRYKLKMNQRKKEIQDLAYQLKGFLFEFVRSVQSDQNLAYIRLKTSYFNLLKQVESKTKPSCEYSFFWSYLFDHMDVVLQVAMKPKYRKVFIDLTNDFKRQ